MRGPAVVEPPSHQRPRYTGSVGAPDIPAIDLMQPTLVARPFHRPGWVYEKKYDGWRMLAYKANGQVRLVSRPGRDHTRRFPDLVAAIRALPAPTLILDGEVVIFDHHVQPLEFYCVVTAIDVEPRTTPAVSRNSTNTRLAAGSAVIAPVACRNALHVVLWF
jgi:ATP-dependent DNA ligase